MLNVAETLRGKRILFVGSTGFVGKVALSMLLRHYPEVGKVFALVRPGAGSTSDQRFFEKVVSSPAFDPIRDHWGDETDAYLREKVVPLAGDVARPMLNFSDEDFERFGDLDVIVNSAGLVDFSPSLAIALRINTLGVRNVVDVAKRTGAGVVHISTCFVAGGRDGEVWEDVPVGYYPRFDDGELRDTDFDVDAEIADCQRLIDEVQRMAKDRSHVSMFRERAARRLREQRRDEDDPKTMRLAVARERKVWTSQRLTKLGMERAQHWGWPNIYTYTKSLGDQVLAKAGGDIRWALLRPAIVETSVRYPFPGWNEGFTTSAPLIFMTLKGHRTYPAHPKSNLDIVPCDLVASTVIAVTAAVIAGENDAVYHVSTSDKNPLPLPRAVELTALTTRKYWKDLETGNKLINEIRSRLEAVPRGKRWYNFSSSPAVKNTASFLSRILEQSRPRWGAPRLQQLADEAKQKLDELARLVQEKNEIFDLFMPFIHDRHYVFRSDNVRKLFATLSEADAKVLHWDPENIHWRDYFFDIHVPALRKWVFPDLEAASKPRPPSVYTYGNLVELFHTTAKLHKQRVALRLLPAPGSTESVRKYTYSQLYRFALRAAALLREAGVQPDDRVAVCSESRPEWAIAYFAILLAGGVAVPADEKSSTLELVNILRASRARLAIISEKSRERLDDLEPALTAAALGDVTLLGLDEMLLAEPRNGKGFEPASPRGDDVASIIFTSGTTGNPKGVTLTHKNFTSLISKLVAIYNPTPHDKLLSVLPLHHTFEFTAGLLMPLSRGGMVTYLEELNVDTLNAAFEEGAITAMIGVPALWQMLHRKITKAASEQGPWVEEAFKLAVAGSRKVRDRTGLNVGKFLFWPIQQKLGGRIRLMVSGGSSLPPEVMEDFRGLGFDLFEGYGLTEAAPVLTAQRPGSPVVPGSVGEALPGVDVRIEDPDERGVGEIIARGPNIMKGYYENDEATASVIRDGWLHTGDLGRMEGKRLHIVGRKKEMILSADGENVYPDELEELYRDSTYVKELSIVGLPNESGSGELVACLLLPNYEARGADGDVLPRELVREKLHEHVKEVSARLPHARRIKVLQLWDGELPRTATRKVKRTAVVRELQKLQRASVASREARTTGTGDIAWLLELVASVSQLPQERLGAQTDLREIGFDSLMYAELGAALESTGVALSPDENLQGITTVSELARFIGPRRGGKERRKRRRKLEVETLDELPVGEPLVRVGRKVLRWGQRLTYERLLDVKVTGRAHLPRRGPFLVAANHASHLDMGLVKHALGDWGPHLHAFAAKDYFFEDRLKRAYFGNFTNLIPMERQGSVRESLRIAQKILGQGYLLLIFPEGTRSVSGKLAPFKASLGYLAMRNKVDVLPIYLEGTHDALPKGASWPKGRKVAAHIGPAVTVAAMREAAAGLANRDQHRMATYLVETAVRRLAKLSPPEPPVFGRAAAGGMASGRGASGNEADNRYGNDDSDDAGVKRPSSEAGPGGALSADGAPGDPMAAPGEGGGGKR